jgi:hypothetical protein
MIADDLQHLRRAKAVNQNVLRHLRHIATVGSLVKDDVDIQQRRMHRLVILHVALAELGRRIDPWRLAILVRLRFEVIEDSNLPAVADKSKSTMWEPMSPAPPVTSARF